MTTKLFQHRLNIQSGCPKNIFVQCTGMSVLYAKGGCAILKDMQNRVIDGHIVRRRDIAGGQVYYQ